MRNIGARKVSFIKRVSFIWRVRSSGGSDVHVYEINFTFKATMHIMTVHIVVNSDLKKVG